MIWNSLLSDVCAREVWTAQKNVRVARGDSQVQLEIFAYSRSLPFMEWPSTFKNVWQLN